MTKHINVLSVFTRHLRQTVGRKSTSFIIKRTLILMAHDQITCGWRMHDLLRQVKKDTGILRTDDCTDCET